RALAPSTKKPPSSPCGFPTRPTGTRSEATFRELCDRFFAGRLQLGPVVRRPPMDEVEKPVGARLLLVRHADAACVHDPDTRDGAVVLRVRVAADDGRHAELLEEEGDPLLGRPLGEDVDVVPRRCVAVENVAD